MAENSRVQFLLNSEISEEWLGNFSKQGLHPFLSVGGNAGWGQTKRYASLDRGQTLLFITCNSKLLAWAARVVIGWNKLSKEAWLLTGVVILARVGAAAEVITDLIEMVEAATTSDVVAVANVIELKVKTAKWRHTFFGATIFPPNLPLSSMFRHRVGFFPYRRMP